MGNQGHFKYSLIYKQVIFTKISNNYKHNIQAEKSQPKFN